MSQELAYDVGVGAQDEGVGPGKPAAALVRACPSAHEHSQRVVLLCGQALYKLLHLRTHATLTGR